MAKKVNNDAALRDYEKRLAGEVADFILTASQENLVRDGAIDTGALLQSGERTSEPGAEIVEYTAPYAAAINDGTKPHWVSPKALEGWVRRKFGAKSEKEIKRIAFLISRKIAARGTIPRPFFDEAVEKARVKFKI